MRRQPDDEVAAAARRRMDLLERELAQAGLTPRSGAHSPDSAELGDHPDLGRAGPSPSDPGVGVVPPLGRHRSRGRDDVIARVGVPAGLSLRLGLSRGPVLLVLGLLGLAVLAGSWAVLRMGTDAELVPARAPTAGDPAPATSAAAPAPSAATETLPATGTTASSGGEVVVDVSGKVRRPGIAVLPAGSRVQDALRMAGGVRKGVDLSTLNRARVLLDGEQILVGVAPAPGAAAAAVTEGGVASPAPAGGLVNLNTAGAGELEELPGVGPVTAQKILDWRAEHGAFSSLDELLEIDGIGEKTFAELADRATL